MTSDVYSVDECIGTVYTCMKDRRGSDRMVVGFTIIYAISTYHNIAAGIDMGVSG
jgi:hypothetical protein